MPRTSRIAAAGLAATLLATACSSNKGDRPNTVVAGAYLQAGSNCDQLLDRIKAEATKVVGPYGFGGPVLMEDMARTTSAAAPGGASTGGAAEQKSAVPSHSTTNVQEVGIDEPDLVKTDGKRILVMAKQTLSIVDITGAPRIVGSVRIAEESSGLAVEDLLVAGNRVLVFGRGWDAMPAGQPSIAPGGVTRDAIMPIGNTSATITEVDITDMAKPVIGKRLTVDGNLLTARQIGDVARVVVNSQPQQLEFVYPQSPGGEARAKRLNQEVVRDSKLSDWLPRFTLADATGKPVQDGTVAACERVAVPKEFSGFGTLNVLTIDMSQPLGTGDAVSVLAGAETVYASDKTLYVATNKYVQPDEQGNFPEVDDYRTQINAFSIEGKARASYLGTGEVPGHLLNQFSMSEHEGVLRAATTVGSPWGNGSESKLTTLKRDGDKLVQVGQVGGLGKNERIYSVRYVGPTAYVVTFRQTDPFYTVDLSNPAAPKVLGELKIPGYSGYLHPISATQVLGVGQNATDEGRVTGTKVSLFDVSNLASPKEVNSWTLPGSNTQAEFDHHAFLYWADKKIAVLPIQLYGGGGGVVRPGIAAPLPDQPFMGAIVLSIDGTIKELGRIEHALTQSANKGQSDCQPISDREITDRFGHQPNMLMQVCGSGAKGGAIGFQCSRISPETLRQLGVKSPEVPAGGYVQQCYDTSFEPNPIMRSLVAADRIWTVSPNRLQSNAFGDLKVLDQISL